MRLMFVHTSVKTGAALRTYFTIACGQGYGTRGGAFRITQGADAIQLHPRTCPMSLRSSSSLSRPEVAIRGHQLDWVRLLSSVPHARRVVIDCDGNYNNSYHVEGDANTLGFAQGTDACGVGRVCDSLSDTILQPPHHPLWSNVRPFFFHAYSPSWEVPLNFKTKEFGMVYVGNNWFRWRSLIAFCKSSSRCAIQLAVWCSWAQAGTGLRSGGLIISHKVLLEIAAYLKQLGVEVIPPIRFDNVLSWMSRGLFNPVIYRPLFDHLQLVTCRTFETIAANTLPLFCQKPEFVSDVYGPAALELVLPEHRPEDKIMDLFERTQHYARVVENFATSSPSVIPMSLASRNYSKLSELSYLSKVVVG